MVVTCYVFPGVAFPILPGHLSHHSVYFLDDVFGASLKTFSCNVGLSDEVA
jgi:hypothetical protein